MTVEELVHKLYSEAYVLRLRAEKLEEEVSNAGFQCLLEMKLAQNAVKEIWDQYDAIMITINVIEERAT